MAGHPHNHRRELREPRRPPWRSGRAVDPAELAIVLPIIEQVEVDLERISLGALIIALTLLVDEAMTTVDAMIPAARGRRQDGGGGGTLVTIAGFVPIGFAASAAGEYTFSIFVVVGIALIVSRFMAVIFAPLVGPAVLNAPKHQGAQEPELIMRLYRRLLIGAMWARWLTILVTIGLFGAALSAIRFVPQQFFRPPTEPRWWSI